MATIKKQGKGYKITVSHGYDINGKQIRLHKTWAPDPGMTPRQISKELARESVLFEEEVHNGLVLYNRIKLADFASKYMADYGSVYLKPKTYCTYQENLKKINAALGHIKLCDLRATHINSFYKNLQEQGVRDHVTAVCKFDLITWVKSQQISFTQLAKLSGLSRYTVKSAADGKRISKDSADKIAAAVGEKPTDIFIFDKNMTPLAPASILSYHRTLTSILSKAVKWGYILTNPADSAEKPALGKREAPYLEEGEARRLLELLQLQPIKWRALITFDLLSGLRRGEILGLRWCDVNIDDCTITIRQTSNYLPGRGIYVGPPKTTSSQRPLRLSRAAILMLLEYKRWQDTQRTLLGDAWEDRDGRVFTTDSGAPIFPDSVTQWFSNFIKNTGLPKVTVHSLRHTYATLMIADGVPLVVVSQQLGHAQASTTANIYAHAIASAQARAAQTFDRFNDLVSGSGASIENEKQATGK